MTGFQQNEDNYGELRLPWDEDTYAALRRGDNKTFKNLLSSLGMVDFSCCNLRGVDLRGVNIKKVVLRGAYLKGADLRGLNLSLHDLEGASLHGARISGVFFPSNLSPDEIMMSVQTGTRLRASPIAAAGPEAD